MTPRILLPTVIVLVVAGVLWWTAGSGRARAPAAPAPATVVTAIAEVREIPVYATGVGTVESLHSVLVRPQVDGILTEVLFTEGQDVEAGQLLARIDDRAILAALEQTRAAKRRNEAQLASARDDLERYRALVEKRTIPRQTVDQQEALVSQLEAAVGEDDANIAAAEVRLTYTHIESPVRGRTGIRRVDPGNLVRSADADGIVSITQMDPIAVVFSLPQDRLADVQQRLASGTATVTVLDREGGSVLGEGRLLLVDNEINTGAGTIRLKAEFPNPQRSLWPGQFVTARMPVTVHTGRPVIPAQAVQRGREGPYVYRIKGDTADIVAITLAHEDDTLAVVEAGLSAGDIVVRDGQSRLKPGATVRVLQ